MATADIEVLGGGIFGLSVAYACLKRGAKVRLVERAHIGAGASGGLVGALAPHTPDNWNAKKQFQFESLIAAPAYWAEVDALSGLNSGYKQSGRLSPVVSEKLLPLAQARVETAKGFWREHGQWQVIESGGFPGWEPESPTGYLIYDSLTARISPRAACASLAGAIKNLGGEIILGGSPDPKADVQVLCTGTEGLADLSAELGEDLGGGVKGQGMLIAYDAKDLPQIFADGVHIVPHANGTTAIGSTSERTWEDANSTDHRLEAVYAQALNICPALLGAKILNRWAGVRPKSRRRTPILGRHPLRDGVYIANGGFKIGFGVAIKSGEVMADLILNGHADIPEKFTVAGNLQ